MVQRHALITLFLVTIALLPAASAVAADAPAKKMNVLFLVADDYCAEMGAFGNPIVQTPNLDKLAARGVKFDRAYCQYPLCGPTRCSFMSGMRPAHIGVITNGPTVRDFKPDVVTLPQLFRNNGYFSARVGKIYHLGIPNNVGTPGPDDPISWDYTFNPKGAEYTTDGDFFDPDPKYGQGFKRTMGTGDGHEQHDFQAADEAIKLLREHKDKPFFLAVGFIRPHVPEIAPKKYFDLYDMSKIQLPAVAPNDRDDIPAAAFHRIEPWWGMDELQCRESIRAYYATISFMDAQLGRVVDELDKLGLADNTIITFVGDHGYLLGQHQAWQKMMLFEGVARVPFIVAMPKSATAGKTAHGLIESVDLYPTVASACGLTPPADVDGTSLLPMVNDPTSTLHEAAFTQVRRGDKVQGQSIRTDRWRLTVWTGDGGGIELYDEQNDPNEWKNLATDPANAELIETLIETLKKKLNEKAPLLDKPKRINTAGKGDAS